MGSATIEAQVDIARSPEDVFDYCSDHRHEPEWNPMMRQIEKVTDGPVGVGTQYETKFAKGPPMVMECVEYERPTRWSTIGRSAAMKADGGGTVVPAAGGAHLTMWMGIKLQGVLRLATPFLRHRLRTDFERDMARIKVILENDGPYSRPS